MPLDLTGINLDVLRKSPTQGIRRPRNPLAAGFASGVDALQGLGYSAGAAVADALGANNARDWFLDRATLNQFEAQEAGRPDLERVEDQDLSTALPFIGYQIAKQIPQIGGALAAGAVLPQVAVPAALSRGAAMLPRAVGGGGATAGATFGAQRAAVEAGQRFGRNLVGGAGLGSVMGLGAMYGESVEAGDPSPYAAMAAAPIYGLAEGLPTALLGNTIARGAFRGSLPTRMAKAAGANALTGATSELAQNEMEMAFNPTLDPDEVFSRRLNAAVVGGLAEGAIGSLGGLRRPQNLLPGANPQRDEPPPPATPVQDPTAAAGGEGLPRLSQAATPGVTGSLFDEVAGPVRPQPPEAPETYEELLSAARSIEAYLNEARATGNRALEDAALSALNQVYAQVNALQPGQPGQMPLWSGVYETVGGRPIELTGTEAARGGLPTLDGEREFAPPQDRRQQEIAYAIRTTNQSLPRGERMTPAQVGRFINQYLALLDRPADLQEFLQTASIPDPVLTVALDIAEGRQRQMVDFGTGFAQPGVRVGQAPVSTGTEEQIREKNRQQAAEERQAAEAETARLRQESELESANARVEGQRARETGAKRRQMLDEALEGATSTKNARNRFVRRLRKEGMAGGITPAESQAIERYFDAVAATTPPPQPPTEIPSTPNEMPADLVPERAEREAPPATRTTRRDRPGFSLSPPPQTQADLDNLARAQARRDRRAARDEQPPGEAPQEGRAPRQGEMFTPKTGQPTAEATMVTIEVTDEDGNPVQIDVAASKVKDYKAEIKKFKALIDCLQSKR